jgi:5'-nucleotidase
MAAEPLILLTNDDGFFAEGIQALYRGVRGLGRLFIVAPDRERSASSLSLSLRQPLRVQRIKPNIYSVDGTPADCIYLAMKRFLPRPPDLIISGMNPGPNLGQQDVSYSGTVSAAIQGTFFCIPSIAVSLIADRDGDFHFKEGARVVYRFAAFLLEHKLPEGITLNINIPPPPFKGLKITRVGIKRYESEIIEKKDPREISYYWIGRGNPQIIGGREGDVQAAHQGYLSVTPLRMDLTDDKAMALPVMTKLGAAVLNE